MIKKLKSIATLLAQLSITTGQLVSWATLFMVLFFTYNILSSWLLNSSSIFISESITWMHSANFLLAAGYTLNHNEHVRVDVFYSRFSAKSKAIVDLSGSLLLLMPVCIFILWSSWSYVELSWRIGEISAEPGGLPATFVLKSLLIVMPVLLILEGINQIVINLERLFDSAASPDKQGAG